MMSITFCLVVGNDWYFILCNFGGLIMRSFKEREGASGSLLSPFHPPPPSALPPLQEETKSPVLRINALSFWNHSWTQLNSKGSIQICSLTFFQYLPWRIWTYLNRFRNFSVSRFSNFFKFRPITKFIAIDYLVICIFETMLKQINYMIVFCLANEPLITSL